MSPHPQQPRVSVSQSSDIRTRRSKRNTNTVPQFWTEWHLMGGFYVTVLPVRRSSAISANVLQLVLFYLETIPFRDGLESNYPFCGQIWDIMEDIRFWTWVCRIFRKYSQRVSFGRGNSVICDFISNIYVGIYARLAPNDDVPNEKSSGQCYPSGQSIRLNYRLANWH